MLYNNKRGVSIMIQAYKEYWQNMTVMNATATRSQYWWPQVVNYLVLFLYGLVTNSGQYYDFSTDTITNLSLPAIIFIVLSLAIWLANFTVRARRLHDTNRSNWWVLLYLLPFIGAIIMFIFLVLPSKRQSRWTINQAELNR